MPAAWQLKLPRLPAGLAGGGNWDARCRAAHCERLGEAGPKVAALPDGKKVGAAYRPDCLHRDGAVQVGLRRHGDVQGGRHRGGALLDIRCQHPHLNQPHDSAVL